MIRFVLALVLTASSWLAHCEEALPQQLPPEQEAAALRAAEVTGRALYRHDRAAWVATDAVLALPRGADERTRGWVTEEQAQGEIVVTFVDQTPAAIYRVRVSAQSVAGPLEVLDPPAAMTAFEAGAFAARVAALAAPFQPCARTYNSVVLPATGAPGENWSVYLMPGATKSNVLPIGGSYRMEVSGSRVTSQRSFTHSCIALQKEPNAVGLAISHLLDPTPTEVHVFWSLWARIPLFVLTPPNGTVWTVEGDKIRLLERKPSKS